MGNMTFTVLDAQTGSPIPNAEVTANYNTSPCAWDAWGCTSGDGQQIQGYTDSNGQYQWSIPFSCAGSFTAMTAQANGYASQTINNQSFGANPGSLGQTFQMVSNSQATPPGQGASAWWDSVMAALGYSGGQTEGETVGLLGGASWILIALLAVVAIIIIAIVALLWSV